MPLVERIAKREEQHCYEAGEGEREACGGPEAARPFLDKAAEAEGHIRDSTHDFLTLGWALIL